MCYVYIFVSVFFLRFWNETIFHKDFYHSFIGWWYFFFGQSDAIFSRTLIASLKIRSTYKPNATITYNSNFFFFFWLLVKSTTWLFRWFWPNSYIFHPLQQSCEPFEMKTSIIQMLTASIIQKWNVYWIIQKTKKKKYGMAVSEAKLLQLLLILFTDVRLLKKIISFRNWNIQWNAKPQIET